jgi:hypothetical protein
MVTKINPDDVDTSAAEEAVEAFQEAEEEFKTLLQDIKDSMGEDWYEYFLETMEKRRNLCSRARNTVRDVGTGVGVFAARTIQKNVWDVDAVLELARIRDEQEDLLGAGVLKYAFDPKRAIEELDSKAFEIYKEKAHSKRPGTTQVLGPKVDDDLFK